MTRSKRKGKVILKNVIDKIDMSTNNSNNIYSNTTNNPYYKYLFVYDVVLDDNNNLIVNSIELVDFYSYCYENQPFYNNSNNYMRFRNNDCN